MATNNINSRKVRFELEKRLKRSQEIFKDPTFLRGLANETAEQIKTRTKLTKSSEKNGSSKKLKALKNSYKDQRRKYRNNLSSDTTPTRSNLTATGQMLNAIFGRYRNKQIEIDIKSPRGNDLTGRKSKANNKELVKYNEDKGRRFFDLTSFELNELKAKIRNKIQQLLAKK